MAWRESSEGGIGPEIDLQTFWEDFTKRGGNGYPD